MAKRGRKSVYDTKIKPRFDDILYWLRHGATEKQIIENLSINTDTFYKYKSEKTEFSELLKKGKESLVEQLRGALIKKALGFEYTETKRFTKIENGKQVQTIEETKKQSLPDVAAANLLLKNYDKDNWSNDPRNDDLKREELEMKKKLFDKENW